MAGQSLVAIVQGTALAFGGQVNTPQFDAGNSGTAKTIDWNNGNVQKVTLTGNVTFTLSNPVAGAKYTLLLVQDATGGRTITWPGSVVFTGGKPPVDTDVNAITKLELFYDGTSYHTIWETNNSFFDAGNSGASKTIDWDDGKVQQLTLTANTTLTLSDPLAGMVYILKIVQDATGGRTITWPAAVKFRGDGVIDSAVNAVSLVLLHFDGTDYQAVIVSSRDFFAVGNGGATPAIDWNNGSIQSVTLNANATFTLSNPQIGRRYTLILKQDATGGRTVTWPAAVKVQGDPSIDGAANAITLVDLYYDGTDYQAIRSNNSDWLNAGNSGTALTIDFSTGLVQTVTLTGNCTFTFAGAKAGRRYTLLLAQDGTGSRTVTWPAAVKWSAATAPTLTTTPAKVDKIELLFDGTNYFGTSSLNY